MGSVGSEQQKERFTTEDTEWPPAQADPQGMKRHREPLGVAIQGDWHLLSALGRHATKRWLALTTVLSLSRTQRPELGPPHAALVALGASGPWVASSQALLAKTIRVGASRPRPAIKQHFSVFSVFSVVILPCCLHAATGPNLTLGPRPVRF